MTSVFLRRLRFGDMYIHREVGHVMTEPKTGMIEGASQGMPRIAGNSQKLGRCKEKCLPRHFRGSAALPTP